MTRSSWKPRSYEAARLRWLAAAISSCASRVMPHSWAVTAMWSPIDMPVRGSLLRGISGTTWAGRMLASALIRCWGVLARLSASRVWRRSSLTAIGASDAESTPPAIAGVDLPEGDLVRGQHDGLEPGAARLLDVVGGRGRRELRPEDGLAGEVEVAAVLEHRAGDDLADLLAGQPEPGDQAVEGGGEHVLVGRPGVRTAGAGERDPVAADHRGAAGGGGRGLTWPSVCSPARAEGCGSWGRH